MVNGPAAADAVRPTVTGIERSNPPPSRGWSEPIGRADVVSETGVPLGPEDASDWSKDETLERQG